jgi:hypothetical protein
MTRLFLFPAALALAATLGGCNETTGGAGPIVSAPAAGPIGPTAYKLPPHAGCTGEINRYQGVVKADLETGNVEQKVYDDIQRDLTKAAAACEAGRESEARSIVASSRSRHGYRA